MVFPAAFFLVRRHVAMPAINGNFHLFAKFLQSPKLVVNQRLQRADVNRLHRRLRIGGEF